MTRLRPAARLPAVATLTLTLCALALGRAEVGPLAALQGFAARLGAAADLVRDGEVDAATIHLRAARAVLLPALQGAVGDASPFSAALERAEGAAEAGDATAARSAASQAERAADAASRPYLVDDDAVASALGELVRQAEHEGVEAADAAAPEAGGTGAGGAEPAALARALARRAVALAVEARRPSSEVQALRALEAAVAGDQATSQATSTVQAAADAARAALGVAAAPDDTARYLATIRSDLRAAAQSYAAGDADAAEEALIDAYLENFEYLEPPLGRADPELKESLEHTLRDDLRALIANGAEPATFRAAVEAALRDLGLAEQALR